MRKPLPQQPGAVSAGTARRRRPLMPALMSALALAAAGVQAQVPGVLVTVEGREMQGRLSWRAVARKYTVATADRSGKIIEIELAPEQVKAIKVPEPRELAPALEAVRAGKGASAMPVLEKIMRDYAMLPWDEPAARGLAEAHLQNNNPAAAVKVCETVIAYKPEAAYSGELAVVYWEALLKAGRTAKLSGLLDEAVKKGDRETSAAALLKRGDLLMEKKQPREALKDGYLRVVVLYENVRSLQPEALYKAAQAFDALQQHANANKMRTLLRTRYPGSEYAKKL